MRIGIVTDRAPVAQDLRRAVALNEHHVLWIAKTGLDGVECCARDTPDLVLMDLAISGMDGVETTRRIMAASPCAILILTESVPANAARVFEAMGHGALDAVEVPTRDAGNLREIATPVLAKLVTLSRLIGERPASASGVGLPRTRSTGPRSVRLVAIGASAGGPAALATLLGGLPKEFPAAIVIVQHVDEHFALSMTQWLAQHSAVPVRVAMEGDRPAAGTALLAGTSDHLTLKSADRLGYSPEPRQQVYRPSVDVFFQSVSRLWSGDVVGVLLTGMGKDGALGLKSLRDQGHHTIAQDERTSALYGMPKAAAAVNAAVEILPMDRISKRLIEVCRRPDLPGGRLMTSPG